MVRLVQLQTLRAVAQAAREQNMLTPFAYAGVMLWIDRLEQQIQQPADELAIRKASEIMIRRCRSVY